MKDKVLHLLKRGYSVKRVAKLCNLPIAEVLRLRREYEQNG